MVLQTASQIISFSKNLEEESAAFYEQFAITYPHIAHEEIIKIASENRKYIKQIQTAYYGVISDALEGCFAFNLDADNYRLNLPKLDSQNVNAVIEKIADTEKIITSYYLDAYNHSKGLLADVPVLFKSIADKREKRIHFLKSMLSERN
jgi:hypothetical protein